MELFCCKTEYDPVLLKRAFAICPKWRRERAERITDSKRFAEYVTAGALLRYSLGKSADDIAILPSGKPVILGGERFFSLSHSGEYAVCAVSDKPIGVDIQRIAPIPERVIKRFCTGREQKQLNDSLEREKAAVKLWALKESYLKASEKSLSEVFGREFVISADDSVTGVKGYCCSLFEQIDGYVTAVCEKQ